MKKLLTLVFIGLSTITFSQLSNGMVAYFPFNGDVNDYSSNNIASTNHGPSPFTMNSIGSANEAIQFVDTSTYVTFNDNIAKVNFPLSISTWIKLDSLVAGQSTPIFFSDNVHNNYHGYWLVMGSGKQVGFGMGGGNGSGGPNNRRSFTTSDTLTLNQWHHIAVIAHDFDDVDIYIDCQPTTGSYSGTGSTTIVYSNTESRIGRAMSAASFVTGAPLHGSLDEFAIWNRALTGVEVGQLCSTTGFLSIADLELKKDKELIGIYDLLGRKSDLKPNEVLIKVYSDGSTEKAFVTE